MPPVEPQRQAHRRHPLAQRGQGVRQQREEPRRYDREPDRERDRQRSGLVVWSDRPDRCRRRRSDALPQAAPRWRIATQLRLADHYDRPLGQHVPSARPARAGLALAFLHRLRYTPAATSADSAGVPLRRSGVLRYPGGLRRSSCCPRLPARRSRSHRISKGGCIT